MFLLLFLPLVLVGMGQHESSLEKSLTMIKHPVHVLVGITAKLQSKTKRDFFSLIPAQLLHLYFHREGENRRL